MTKKKKIITGCIAVSVLLTVVVIFALLRRASSDAESTEAYATQVSLLSSNSANGIVSRFAGVVEPQKTVKIQKASDKNIKEVYVKEGDTVTKGAPLFSYDVDEIQLKLSGAELELERITNEISTLYDQIKLLEEEKKKAPESETFSYTTQILTAQNDVKRAEYNKKSKTVEIEQIKTSMENATVVSEIDGVVKSINDGSSQVSYGYTTDDAYITILSNNEYRIKGTINEQNMASISVGQPMVVHSRTEEDLTWKGTVTEVDTQNPVKKESGYSMNGNSDTSSSSYNFYVELEGNAFLMLGQHVFMEPDIGQNEVKEGLWIPDYYLCFEEDATYVWAAGRNNKLEKREVTLGDFDDALFEYEIISGLTEEDYIVFPDDTLTEGMHCNKVTDISEGMVE